MRITVIFLFISLLFSCKEDKRTQIAHLVAEWQNKELLFPDSLVFTSYLIDTVDYTFNTEYPKIVIYSDSLGCMSCKLQLNKWKSFIGEVESLTDGKVPFLFFFSTNQLKDMKHLLRRDRFDYPVCLDREDRMNELNHFPVDPSFHTFLIDKDNRVILIGNPVTNGAMKELYLKEITQFFTSQIEESSGIQEKKSVEAEYF